MTVSAVLAVALALGAVGYLSLAAYVWAHRAIPGAAGLTLCLLALGTWIICYALELSSTTVAAAQWWSGLKYVGIVLLAPGLWAFVLRYTAHSRPLSRRVIALLMVEPVVILLLLAIPATQHLIHYYPVEVAGEAAQQKYVGHSPQAANGVLIWPHAVYTYVMCFGAMGLLVARLARLGKPYRRESMILMVAVALPFLGNVLYIAAVDGFGHVDPSPFLFSVSAVIFVWGLLRVRMLGIQKVARSVVLDRLPESVLVLDMNDRIADVNKPAEQLLGVPRDRLVGTVLTTRLPAVAAVLARHMPGGLTEGEVRVAGLAGGRGADGPGRDVAVEVTSILQAQEETSRLVVLRDITESKATQRRLVELLRDQTMLAETLQQSLRPPSTPSVPGAELAARWVPSGVDTPLSGDFYDIHPAGPGDRWAFVLGDVVGKGVHAAVLTALARYTARALSAQGVPPDEVMSALNEALLSEDTERFCTVVYGVASPRPEGAAGLRIQLVLGGHPQPLVRRLDGTIVAVGVPGTVLGLLTPASVVTAEVNLEPGEILLGYTDGITEARALAPGEQRPSGEQFGEERLAQVLSEAQPRAEAVADAVLHAVEAFALHRDDVALLVIRAT